MSGISLRRHDQPDAAAIWAQMCRWDVARAMLWDIAEPLREGIFPSACTHTSTIFPACNGSSSVRFQ